jgi:hypothetical protein
VSDCFCNELAVWAVSLEDVEVVRVGAFGVDKDELDEDGFRLATR